jgi:hypothetical protein
MINKRKCLTCKRILDVCGRCGQGLIDKSDIYCLDCALELNNKNKIKKPMGKKKKNKNKKGKAKKQIKKK